MKLINNEVTNLTPEIYTIEAIKKHIELCGRTCYKSESKITNTSAEKFVDMLNSNKHRSVLEHGTVYLHDVLFTSSILNKYCENPYSIVNMESRDIYITTNYRVIIENGWEDDLKYICKEPSYFHVKRHTFRITCSKAIANEIVRHRNFSFSQESTRYCNYSKEKFGGELLFIKPYWFGNNIQAENIYTNFLKESEKAYLELLQSGLKPEAARGVLPLDLKTDLIVTGTKEQWDAFFKLRCAKSAHPDIQIIANQIKDMIYGEY